MLDINGQELREDGAALLLCEILEITNEGVRVRILNSDIELFVGAKHDEVLGGLVADSELTAFLENSTDPAPEPVHGDNQADSVKVSRFE